MKSPAKPRQKKPKKNDTIARPFAHLKKPTMEDTKTKQKTQFVGVRLDEETLAALKNDAQQNGRSVSAELRERLAEFLKISPGVSTPETEDKC